MKLTDENRRRVAYFEDEKGLAAVVVYQVIWCKCISCGKGRLSEETNTLSHDRYFQTTHNRDKEIGSMCKTKNTCA